MRKVFKLLAAAAGLAATFLLLGAVDSHRNAGKLDEVVVRVQEVSNALIDADGVRAFVDDLNDPHVGKPVADVNVSALESELLQLPHVAEVSVYKTIDRKLVVEVEPREAVARIIDRHGHNALLDARGCLVPVSGSKPLRLPVITGAFDIDPEAVQRSSLISEMTEDSEDALERIRHFASVAFANPFWKAQLQHTHLNANGDFVSVARVGGHIINFGAGQKIEEKLAALDILYREGMDESTWNKYSAINLKYENQIICTEKH